MIIFDDIMNDHTVTIEQIGDVYFITIDHDDAHRVSTFDSTRLISLAEALIRHKETL